jgi:hypothetical protein
MTSTLNFTGAVDHDLLKRAKIIAAKADTSVNALFNAELRYLVETFEAAEASGNQNYRVLLDFSLGRRAGNDAMLALGIESEEDLFLLMAQAHLPMPRLSDTTTRGMVDQLKSLAGLGRRDVRACCPAARRWPAHYAGLRRCTRPAIQAGMADCARR